MLKGFVVALWACWYPQGWCPAKSQLQTIQSLQMIQSLNGGGGGAQTAKAVFGP